MHHENFWFYKRPFTPDFCYMWWFFRVVQHIWHSLLWKIIKYFRKWRKIFQLYYLLKWPLLEPKIFSVVWFLAAKTNLENSSQKLFEEPEIPHKFPPFLNQKMTHCTGITVYFWICFSSHFVTSISSPTAQAPEGNQGYHKD